MVEVRAGRVASYPLMAAEAGIDVNVIVEPESVYYGDNGWTVADKVSRYTLNYRNNYKFNDKLSAQTELLRELCDRQEQLQIVLEDLCRAVETSHARGCAGPLAGDRSVTIGLPGSTLVR